MAEKTERQTNPKQATDGLRELKQENKDAIGHMRSLLDKADDEKKARDAENAIVKQLVAELDKLRKAVEAERKTTQALEKELGPVKKDLFSLPLLRKQIDSLEYMLHVQGSSPNQERRISKQINELTAKIKTLTASQPKVKALEAARQKFREASAVLAAKVKELREHADLSEGHHGQMTAALEEVHKLEGKLSGSLRELDEKRAELKELKKANRTKELEMHQVEKTRIKAYSPAFRPQLAKVDVKKKADEVLAKFKAGQPITAEEMHLLSMVGAEF